MPSVDFSCARIDVSDPSNVPTAAVTSGFFAKIASVRDEITRRKIIGAVGDHVVVFDQIERIRRLEP